MVSQGFLGKSPNLPSAFASCLVVLSGDLVTYVWGCPARYALGSSWWGIFLFFSRFLQQVQEGGASLSRRLLDRFRMPFLRPDDAAEGQ